MSMNLVAAKLCFLLAMFAHVKANVVLLGLFSTASNETLSALIGYVPI